MRARGMPRQPFAPHQHASGTVRAVEDRAGALPPRIPRSVPLSGGHDQQAARRLSLPSRTTDGASVPALGSRSGRANRPRRPELASPPFRKRPPSPCGAVRRTQRVLFFLGATGALGELLQLARERLSVTSPGRVTGNEHGEHVIWSGWVESPVVEPGVLP